MNPLATLLSAAILLTVSLNASANPVTEDDNSHSQAPQLETHQTHLEHQSTTEATAETTQANTSQRLRNVTHPKTGHVVQRYVGQ